MNYEAMIEKLYHLKVSAGNKLGLQRMIQMHEHLNRCAWTFPTVHVAGTNGKGSVSTKIARVLTLSGYNVGLYTSPHIHTFRERILINNDPIAKESVEALFPSLFQLSEKKEIPLSFFEIMTFLAFQYFAQNKVDIAIIETGLGGRLDATNIIAPLLSVITSISLDHTEILGLTLDAIAYEKAGIIKKNIPVVLGATVPPSVEEMALKKNSTVFKVSDQPLDYNEENNLIAKQALAYLADRFSINDQALNQGLKAKPLCRFEQLSYQESPLILDMAHNPKALEKLFDQIKHRWPTKNIKALVHFAGNKDIESGFAIIAKYTKALYLFSFEYSRLATMEHQSQVLKNLNQSYTILDTLDVFFQSSDKDDLLVVTGSAFVMPAIYQYLGKAEETDTLELN